MGPSTRDTTQQNCLTAIYAVNCGGEEFESPVDGITYEADTYLVGRGQTTVVRALHPVQGNDATLYQSDRSGKHLSYAFPLEKKGFYTLVVKFAETQHRAADQRVMHVVLNGEVVLSHLDIFRAVGHGTALDLSIPFFYTGRALKLSDTVQVSLTSKEAHLDFLGVVGSAKVNAIVLVKGVLTKAHTQLEREPPQPPLDFIDQYGLYLGLATLAVAVAVVGCRHLRDPYRLLFGPTKRQKIASTDHAFPVSHLPSPIGCMASFSREKKGLP